jgi:hypothetical protein
VASSMGGTRISLGCLCPSNVEWRRIEAELELRLSVVALVEVVDERVVALASTPRPETASKHQHKLRSLAHLAGSIRMPGNPQHPV